MESQVKIMGLLVNRDLVRRVPAIRKEELNSLAQAGALNFIRKHRTSRPTQPHIGYWGTPDVHALLFAV